jgi:sulfoxide reductase heme-binding subunit YedZ
MAGPSVRKIAKVFVFLLCFAPAVWLLWGVFSDALGADPVDTIRDQTGDWTLRFLLITLLATPLRQLTGWSEPIRYRRMMGLWAFFYAFVHFFTYLWLDQQFDASAIAVDVAKRPWITAGVASFVLMVPLAITSTKRWIGRLGGKRWQLLHRLIYISAAAGILHYFLLVKLDTSRPVRYAIGLAILLGYRLWMKMNRTNAAQAVN